MARIPMMAGNWKMNNTISEAVVLTQEIINQFEDSWRNVEIVLCPPTIDLRAVSQVLDFEKVKEKKVNDFGSRKFDLKDLLKNNKLIAELAAQNVHWEEKGAFTGETSVAMIKEVGCSYSIVGHSERRELFGETNEMVNQKIKALLAKELGAIVCVGESLGVRDEGTAIDYVCAQVRAAFAGIERNEASLCVIAYEPIWAIGTGRTATPEQADEICGAIRREISDLFDAEFAEEIRVLYGGSMNPGNVDSLLAMENIDGGLVGGASLDSKSFVQLIESAVK